MKKLPQIIIAVALTISVVLGFMIFKVTTDDNTDSILSAYTNNSSSLRKPISVSEIRLQLQKQGESEEGVNPPVPDSGTHEEHPSLGTPSNWLQICDACHKSMGMQGLKYAYGGAATITDLKGNKYRVRTDCSGYVSYCLYTAGLIDANTRKTSQTFGSLDCTEEVDVSDMQPGDLLVYSGHIDIYAGNGKKWNWGSHSSAEDKYVGVLNKTEDINKVDSKVNMGSKKIKHVYRVVIK